MSELDLSLDAMGWLRMLIGLPFLLGPGLALADRWLPKERGRFIIAPVASLSILTLAAFVEDFVLGIGPTPTATFATSLVLTAWIGWPRIKQLPQAAKAYATHGLRLPKLPRHLLWLPLILGFVMLSQSLIHLPGAAPSSNWDVYPTMLDRAGNALDGQDYPYPIHVDEHIHFAFAAKMMRDDTVEFNEVYTDEPTSGELFSVQGFRSERGFTVALVQIHELLGLPLAVMFRFLPAIMTGLLSLTVWYLIRPAPGALVAASMVAMLPSTARFLGTGFLISSTFALIWIYTTLIVVLRAKGPARFFGLMLLVTAAYFQHLVIGTLSIGTALAAMMLMPRLHTQDRIGIVVAALLPMLWIVPGVWADIQGAVGDQTGLPFQQDIFRHPGAFLYLLAALGAVIAFLRPDQGNTAHRALTATAALMALSMWWSLENDHSNDATYSRLLFAFFLNLGILASHAIGRASQLGANQLGRPWTKPVIGAAVALVALSTPIGAIQAEPMYRVHDENSWAAAQAFETSGAGPGDVFLSHPWRAPIFSGATGAVPHTVLYPGQSPDNVADWNHYLATSGADATWLDERNIRFIVNGPVPNAPHDDLGAGVYRLL